MGPPSGAQTGDAVDVDALLAGWRALWRADGDKAAMRLPHTVIFGPQPGEVELWLFADRRGRVLRRTARWLSLPAALAHFAAHEAALDVPAADRFACLAFFRDGSRRTLRAAELQALAGSRAALAELVALQAFVPMRGGLDRGFRTHYLYRRGGHEPITRSKCLISDSLDRGVLNFVGAGESESFTFAALREASSGAGAAAATGKKQAKKKKQPTDPALLRRRGAARVSRRKREAYEPAEPEPEPEDPDEADPEAEADDPEDDPPSPVNLKDLGFLHTPPAHVQLHEKGLVAELDQTIRALAHELGETTGRIVTELEAEFRRDGDGLLWLSYVRLAASNKLRRPPGADLTEEEKAEVEERRARRHLNATGVRFCPGHFCHFDPAARRRIEDELEADAEAKAHEKPLPGVFTMARKSIMMADKDGPEYMDATLLRWYEQRQLARKEETIKVPMPAAGSTQPRSQCKIRWESDARTELVTVALFHNNSQTCVVTHRADDDGEMIWVVPEYAMRAIAAVGSADAVWRFKVCDSDDTDRYGFSQPFAFETAEGDDDSQHLQPADSRARLLEEKRMRVQQETGLIHEAPVQGFSGLYSEVKVCANCYRVYSMIDQARQDLFDRNRDAAAILDLTAGAQRERDDGDEELPVIFHKDDPNQPQRLEPTRSPEAAARAAAQAAAAAASDGGSGGGGTDGEADDALALDEDFITAAVAAAAARGRGEAPPPLPARRPSVIDETFDVAHNVAVGAYLSRPPPATPSPAASPPARRARISSRLERLAQPRPSPLPGPPQRKQQPKQKHGKHRRPLDPLPGAHPERYFHTPEFSVRPDLVEPQLPLADWEDDSLQPPEVPALPSDHRVLLEQHRRLTVERAAPHKSWTPPYQPSSVVYKQALQQLQEERSPPPRRRRARRAPSTLSFSRRGDRDSGSVTVSTGQSLPPLPPKKTTKKKMKKRRSPKKKTTKTPKKTKITEETLQDLRDEEPAPPDLARWQRRAPPKPRSPELDQLELVPELDWARKTLNATKRRLHNERLLPEYHQDEALGSGTNVRALRLARLTLAKSVSLAESRLKQQHRRMSGDSRPRAESDLIDLIDRVGVQAIEVVRLEGVVADEDPEAAVARTASSSAVLTDSQRAALDLLQQQREELQAMDASLQQWTSPAPASGPADDDDALDVGSALCASCDLLAPERKCETCHELYCLDCFQRLHRKGAATKHRFVVVRASS